MITKTFCARFSIGKCFNAAGKTGASVKKIGTPHPHRVRSVRMLLANRRICPYNTFRRSITAFHISATIRARLFAGKCFWCQYYHSKTSYISKQIFINRHIFFSQPFSLSFFTIPIPKPHCPRKAAAVKLPSICFMYDRHSSGKISFSFFLIK